MEKKDWEVVSKGAPTLDKVIERYWKGEGSRVAMHLTSGISHILSWNIMAKRVVFNCNNSH